MDRGSEVGSVFFRLNRITRGPRWPKRKWDAGIPDRFNLAKPKADQGWGRIEARDRVRGQASLGKRIAGKVRSRTGEACDCVGRDPQLGNVTGAAKLLRFSSCEGGLGVFKGR